MKCERVVPIGKLFCSFVVLGTITSGSIKIARSKTQLKTAQPVCIPNVSAQVVRNDSRFDQLAAGVVLHAKISTKRKITVHKVTRTISVQLA